MENSTSATFSDLLLRYLGEKDRSQSWLARQLNVDPSTVSKWINDNSGPASVKAIAAIIDVLELNPSQAQEFFATTPFSINELRRARLDLRAEKNKEVLEEAQKQLSELENRSVLRSIEKKTATSSSSSTKTKMQLLTDFVAQADALLQDRSFRYTFFEYLAMRYPDLSQKQKPTQSILDELRLSVTPDKSVKNEDLTSLAIRLLLDRIENLEKKQTELEDKVQKLEGKRAY